MHNCQRVARLHSFLVQVGNYEQAVQDYTKALQVEPGNSYAYYNRGITRDRNGDYQGAVEDFSHAINLDPANADFFHNRGFSFRKQVTLSAAELITKLQTMPAKTAAFVWMCARTAVNLQCSTQLKYKALVETKFEGCHGVCIEPLLISRSSISGQ